MANYGLRLSVLLKGSCIGRRYTNRKRNQYRNISHTVTRQQGPRDQTGNLQTSM